MATLQPRCMGRPMAESLEPNRWGRSSFPRSFTLVVPRVLQHLATRDPPEQVNNETGDGHQDEYQSPDDELPGLHCVTTSIEIEQTRYQEQEEEE